MNRPSSHGKNSRRGATVLLAVLLLVVMLGMVAFAVDLGYIVLTRTQLQVAADAGALAGAAATIEGTAASEAEVHRFVSMYCAAGQPISGAQTQIQFGNWDTAQRRFTPNASERSAVEVTLRSSRPFFFGRIFGQRNFTCEARAVATFPPRDILLVLDFSGSMCYDSQLCSIGALGRGPVEANLLDIYHELGSPTFGSMTWNLKYVSSNNLATIKRNLGLTTVAYPYPPDTWDNYINYVKNDSTIAQAGYLKKYGYLTWVNYLQSQRCQYSQTPDLWNTSEQPISAVKDAVQLLMAYLSENSPADRVGFSLYTASDGTAKLENSLTNDFARVADTVQHRQAGHYDSYTNIGAGMKTARLELENHARIGARKLMVLMTDGQANRPQNESRGKALALQEAHSAATDGIPILTIALGADADTGLMQQIADITRGVFFEIPGGQTVAEYEEQLKEVFRKVAADRKLQLVQ